MYSVFRNNLEGIILGIIGDEKRIAR